MTPSRLEAATPRSNAAESDIRELRGIKNEPGNDEFEAAIEFARTLERELAASPAPTEAQPVAWRCPECEQFWEPSQWPEPPKEHHKWSREGRMLDCKGKMIPLFAHPSPSPTGMGLTPLTDKMTEEAREISDKVKGNPKLWKSGGAGGQDEYAGLPPMIRHMDVIINRFEWEMGKIERRLSASTAGATENYEKLLGMVAELRYADGGSEGYDWTTREGIRRLQRYKDAKKLLYAFIRDGLDGDAGIP